MAVVIQPEAHHSKLPADYKQWAKERAARGKHAMRRPVPPPGFKRYKRTHIKNRGSRCPGCKDVVFGHWGGDQPAGFQDPEAQTLYDRMERDGYEPRGAGDLTYRVDGCPIMMHWSRWAMAFCDPKRGGCGGWIWHDFGGDGGQGAEWFHYYKPASPEAFVAGEQLTLF